MGHDSVDPVKAPLAKLNSTIIGNNRGSQVSKERELLLRKFAQQVVKVFKKLPKSLEWRSFYRHDLNLMVQAAQEVREVSIQHKLN